MLIFLGVENFAKIESAKVCINSYTLLVGPNNSGKTYLMQLIQGINEKLANLVEEDGLQILYEKENLHAGYRKCVISQRNIEQFTAYINRKLEEKKEQIINEIFGKNISVGKLYIDILLETEERYEIVSANNINDVIKIKDPRDSDSFTKGLLENLAVSQNNSWIGTLMRYGAGEKEGKLLLVTVSFENEILILKSALKNVLEYQSLFLPASRTGIMLLYRDFFANKTDDTFSYQIKENHYVENKNKYGGMTYPVYQFLRFLQTYSEDEERKQYYKKEIDFFEKHLIEGHISINKQNGFSYDSQVDHVNVPMYMASSMVNEIAPFVLALADRELYDGFIIDEIEASLHPQKQSELVRFLNRLSNKGIKLILSTHSDTFASKVNNLYVLSKYAAQNKEDGIVRKLGLERDDLMNPDRLFVYEFITQPDGKSVVKEIEGKCETGFQFDLFTDSAMHLYNEALEIGEMLQNDKS